MEKRFLTFVVFSFLTLCGVPLASADSPILTLQYGLNTRNIMFTDAELMALPQKEFQTETIWTEGIIRFSGPSLKAVLEHSGVKLNNVELYAINDYNIILPKEKIEDNAPIIATRINGKPFSVRDKGPLWVVFPYDEARYNTEEYFAYSVWQLIRIAVVPE